MEGHGLETLPALKIPCNASVQSQQTRHRADSVSIPGTPDSMQTPSLANARMEGHGLETLPALKIPCNASVQAQQTRHWTASVSIPGTPDSMQAPSLANNRLTNVTYKKGRGYPQRTLAYGSPEVVKQLYTGQLPITYFNDICYGRRDPPREFQYRSPNRERERELWEPKYVSREETRHVVRDIQDARFRKQSQLEKKSVRKQYKSKLKTEGALLRQSDIMARGLQAYLGKLDRQKEKYVQTHNARRESIKQKHGALLQSTFSHITQPRVSFCF